MKPNKLSIGILAAATAALVGLGSPGQAQAQPVPDRVSIESIDLRGPGCPPGTASVDLFRDNTAFVITYNEFNAEAGPTVPLTQATTHCVAILDLNIPAGWQWTVTSIAYRGNVTLENSVVARLRARLSFPGMPSVSKEVRKFGPTRVGGEDFELLATYDIFTWSDCGARLPMTITATAQVDNTRNRDRSGQITVEQQDGTFDMVFRLGWRRCHE